MPCLQPLRIQNPRYKDKDASDIRLYSLRVFGCPVPPDKYLDVPCGWCFDCQKRRMNSYRMRLLYEYHSKNSTALFVTLTFDDPSLERFKNDLNKSLVLYFDRLRKAFGKSFRHWFCCEFGTLKGRPHFHGIIFDCPELTAEDIEKHWKYGFTWTGYCNDATIHYITKYITKGTESNEQVVPRVFSSKGIGLSFLHSSEAKICRMTCSDHLVLNGIPTPLPRYYVDKLLSKDDKEHLLWKQYAIPREEYYIGGRKIMDVVEYNRIVEDRRVENIARGLTLSQKPWSLPRDTFGASRRFNQLISKFQNYEFNSNSPRLQGECESCISQPF